MSIATKTGDNGTTGLMFGRRVPKTDARIEACGTVDELCAALGTARSGVEDTGIKSSILEIQKELVLLMGEIAVSDEDRTRYREKGYKVIEGEMVDRLTQHIERLERTLGGKFSDWAMPGGTIPGTAFDVARTVCRRAERRVIETGCPNPQLIPYLNRLSDLCWLLARFVESIADREIITTRLINAPRDIVWAAFTDPKRLARWWGPKGFTNTFHEFDLKPDGHWRFVMRGPDGAEYDNHSVFVEVVKPERIVFRHLDLVHVFEMTITLAEEGKSTRLTWQMVFETVTKCNEVRSFVTEANEQNFDRLEAELKTS